MTQLAQVIQGADGTLLLRFAKLGTPDWHHALLLADADIEAGLDEIDQELTRLGYQQIVETDRQYITSVANKARAEAAQSPYRISLEEGLFSYAKTKAAKWVLGLGAGSDTSATPQSGYRST